MLLSRPFRAPPPLAATQVCRKATYGYDQRVEFFGTTGLVKHDNHFPSAVQKWNGTSVAQADLPHSFFMTRYEDAYKNETRVSYACLSYSSIACCQFLAVLFTCAKYRWLLQY